VAWRVGIATVSAVLVAAAIAGCFDVSKLIFDLDGGPTCGTFDGGPASALVTPFDSDSGMSTGWASVNGCATEKGGALVAAPVPGQVSFCKYYTTGYYHLTCDSVTVKVPQTTTQENGVQTFIYLVAENTSTSVQLVLEGGNFVLGTATAPVPLSAGYDPTTDVWWRLSGLSGSEAGTGQIEFDTSPDGRTWTVKGSGDVPMSLDSVRIELGAGEENEGGVADPGQARFACYDVPPEDCPAP
jgi:hypothetical protein